MSGQQRQILFLCPRIVPETLVLFLVSGNYFESHRVFSPWSYVILFSTNATRLFSDVIGRVIEPVIGVAHKLDILFFVLIRTGFHIVVDIGGHSVCSDCWAVLLSR